MEAKGKPVVAVLSLCVLLASCSRQVEDRPIGNALQLKAPLGLPPIAAPADNPVTEAGIELGRRLFYDPYLSVNNSISCASCHNPGLGFTDGRRFSTGVDGKTGIRNAPTVLNAAYAHLQFWDGRAADLEEQAAGPIANPVEMNQAHDVCSTKLNGDPKYVAAFEKVYGPGLITIRKVQKALASFERTLVSGNSSFDRYQYGGDKSALSDSAIRGLAVFTDKSKGNCVTCHTIGRDYALFSDGRFHNIGVGVDSEGELKDTGRFAETKAEADHGAFRTPSLRNVAKTAPYMHDGSQKTLRNVIDFYIGGGNSNPWLDREMKPLNLTKTERDDLVAFLQSLTGEISPDAGPPTSK